jgi:UPF0755 protein
MTKTTLRWLGLGLGLLLLGALGAGGLVLSVRHYLQTPAGGTTVAVVLVKRGATLRPVLEELSRQHVLTRPQWLYYYARLRHTTAVRSGKYEVHADQNPRTILAMLIEGRVMLEEFTIAEGLNRWQVRAQLSQEEWMAAEEFDALCDNQHFLANNHIAGPSCEGYLFPDTYKFARGVAPSGILQTMFASFKREFGDVTRTQGFGPLALSEREFTTLASIVEKETGVSAERPHIACIFYNRLRARPPWRLETDPTVIYAATLSDPHFDGNLTRNHLRFLESPYNTYRAFGLPPGPIANPGRAALAAVAQPALCKDFFFVANNAGEHIFCPTLDCHNRAVRKWQVDYFKDKNASARKLSAKKSHTDRRHKHHK